MKSRSFFVFFFIVSICAAQNAKILNGKVIADVRDLKGINVENQVSGTVVATLEDGSFSIYAKPGDTLVLTSVQLNEKRIVIEKEDFDYLPFLVKMSVRVIQLKEVVIEKSSITAESLGLVRKGMKTLSPEDRAVTRYYKAQTGPVKALIYALDGTAKRRKIAIKATVKSQMLHDKLKLMFSEAYFVEELKIPSENLNGFYVFASENQALADVMQKKNKWLIKFELVKLASEYNKRLSDEK
ncbi:MAG TPA: hypothetical protein VLB74_11165 [Flavobacterium sp.]|uniref:hypothetical protein n=1 Tax=Flavobacterium sp. TaxID=239 RepID=UPI002C589259|nr:hypothetical protein [Flavobacterium sp.]HSD15198.1 hypothetical protein [Flavobacterium sp.]